MSGRKSITAEQQLMILGQMTEETGEIYEGQILQIKLWPYAVSGDIKSSEAVVSTKDKVISYLWEADSRPDISRLRSLEEAIKILFGSKWKLTVDLNGSPYFPLAKPKKTTKNERATTPRNRGKKKKSVTRRKLRL